MITVKTQIKEILKSNGLDNISSDYMDKLDQKVKQLVLESAQRAKENGRKTVMGKDI
jgi:histone H3/H4